MGRPNPIINKKIVSVNNRRRPSERWAAFHEKVRQRESLAYWRRVRAQAPQPNGNIASNPANSSLSALPLSPSANLAVDTDDAAPMEVEVIVPEPSPVMTRLRVAQGPNHCPPPTRPKRIQQGRIRKPYIPKGPGRPRKIKPSGKKGVPSGFKYSGEH